MLALYCILLLIRQLKTQKWMLWFSFFFLRVQVFLKYTNHLVCISYLLCNDSNASFGLIVDFCNERDWDCILSLSFSVLFAILYCQWQESLSLFNVRFLWGPIYVQISPNECIVPFLVKLVVFKAPTNCFLKNLLISWVLLEFEVLFVILWLSPIYQMSISVSGYYRNCLSFIVDT